MDDRVDFLGLNPFFGDHDEVIFQPSEVAVEPFRCGGLKQTAKSLHRVELGAIGWQWKKAGRWSAAVHCPPTGGSLLGQQ